MLEHLFPKEYIDSIFELDINEMKKNNIKAIIFDIDNTLVPYFIKTADDKLKRFFIKLKKAGFSVGILSNNKEQRVALFCESLKVDYIYKAGKPGTRGLGKLIDKLGADSESTMLVGDQIFTDVWCGNKKGVYTVLVKPVSKKDEWITKIKRGLERRVIDIYLKRRG